MVVACSCVDYTGREMQSAIMPAWLVVVLIKIGKRCSLPLLPAGLIVVFIKIGREMQVSIYL